jgi:uncharacterized CHY-type Zn-finger protein
MRSEKPEEPSYVEALARELASEGCVRCSRRQGWKTAAMFYEGPEWKYYYCYECGRWFSRHFRYRYVVEHVDDPKVIGLLVRHLETQRDLDEAQPGLSWFRRWLKGVNRFFQKYLP